MSQPREEKPLTVSQFESKFSGLENKFSGLEGRFSGLEGKFSGLEVKISGLEGRFSGLEGRFSGLENKFSGFENRFSEFESRSKLQLEESEARLKIFLKESLIEFYHKIIEPRFDKTEKEAKEFREEMHCFRSETLDRFDDLYKKFENLEQEYIVANGQMKRLTKDYDQVGQLQEALVDVRTRLSHIEERVERVER